MLPHAFRIRRDSHLARHDLCTKRAGPVETAVAIPVTGNCPTRSGRLSRPAPTGEFGERPHRLRLEVLISSVTQEIPGLFRAGRLLGRAIAGGAPRNSTWRGIFISNSRPVSVGTQQRRTEDRVFEPAPAGDGSDCRHSIREFLMRDDIDGASEHVAGFADRGSSPSV